MEKFGSCPIMPMLTELPAPAKLWQRCAFAVTHPKGRVQGCLFFGLRVSVANWRSFLRRLVPYHHKLTIVPAEYKQGRRKTIESTAKMRPKEVQKRCSGPPSKNGVHSKTLMTRPTPRHAALFLQRPNSFATWLLNQKSMTRSIEQNSEPGIAASREPDRSPSPAVKVFLTAESL